MAAKYPLQPTPEEFIAMEPEEIRRHIAMGMVPPELSDEQLKQLPPSTLQPYLYARDAAGDSGIIQRAISLFSSGMESRRIFDEKRQELILITSNIAKVSLRQNLIISVSLMRS